MDVSMILGQRMIMGWTLLDVVCGVCKVVPLIEDKKKNFTECVQCHRTFKRENGDLVETKKAADIIPPTAAAAAAATNANVAVVPTTKQVESFRDIDREEYNESRNISNSHSLNSTGSSSSNTLQQLLSSSKQPTTATTTTTTTTVIADKQPKTNHNTDYDQYYDDEDYEPFTESERLQFEQRMKKTDEISTKIGQKLMLGWALLGDVCPNNQCLDTPLMRDREKYFVCVSCGARALDVKDLKKADVYETLISPASSVTTASTPTPMNIEESPLKHNNNNNGISPIKEPIQKRQKKVDEEQQQSSSSSSISSKPTIFNYSNNCSTKSLLHDEIRDMPLVIDKTLETLLNKLKDSETKLGSAGAQETLAQFASIRECSQAITSLLELKKQLLS
ncbi:Sjogrens syndrome scleroderma autoantigen 1 family protein [Cavenderia fasciculata]|uniref:Sjogrens syndrome scleroderma autoantigen 1 family protein n=1 Tax=Cavenderia fasciculata TaxID=261658 RepID=F4Q4C8_CACFS|nr:Sjogrens syndrome scleroderma autoantigen 1 family protein [Cavenderia fasciculata]EGG16990.1 Sjogrens syndrome scleroderma autoantigen 1 family protein [Cavenderia fasciculata]|eukprot:XP_004355474.1 Sjogrens syndrome scleroderma autoantigen 1 family protein [Cavenderia fasciculata]